MIEQCRIPVIAAPMAGGISTPELVSAVGAGGGFGFLASGYLTEMQLAEQIARTRRLSPHPFGVNLFVPGAIPSADVEEYRREVVAEAGRWSVEPGTGHWDDDGYQAKVELVLAEGVPVVSFTFGAPDAATVQRLHDGGSEVVVTVTTPEEARIAADVGADVLCVQGAEAGGHRAIFEDDPKLPGGGPLFGLLAALRLISAEVDLPLIAAGGLVCGADVAAVLAGGAIAAQLGTAFLLCDEAGTGAPQREAITAGDRLTELTRAFSGKPARGLVNRFLSEHSAHAPAAYPQVHYVTKPIRKASEQAGDPEAMSLWAGQTYSRAKRMAAAELVRRLDDEARSALRKARSRLQHSE